MSTGIDRYTTEAARPVRAYWAKRERPNGSNGEGMESATLTSGEWMALETLVSGTVAALGGATERHPGIGEVGRALQDAARELAEAVDEKILNESEANALIKVLAARFAEHFVGSISRDLFPGGALPGYSPVRQPVRQREALS